MEAGALLPVQCVLSDHTRDWPGGPLVSSQRGLQTWADHPSQSAQA